jgi:hypothetical protein
MNMSSSTLREWSLFIGLHLSWCIVASLIWYFARKRFRKPLPRADPCRSSRACVVHAQAPVLCARR